MSGGFEDLSLLPELVRATQDMGWMLPSDVQDESIPLILGGGDVMVAAETGSGKTGAFALPAIQIVHETRRAAVAAAAAGMKAASGSGGAGGAGGRGPNGESAAKRARVEAEPVTLNTNDRSAMLAVSPDGLVCQCRQEKEWAGVRATAGALAGSKVYYEARVNDEGLCRFGWSSMAGSLDLGTDRNGYGFGGTGKKSNAAKFEAYGEAFGKGDVIGCYLDLSADGSGGSISFSKNGKHLGTAFNLPKHAGPLYPAVCMKNAELAVNFGGASSAPFAFPPADGSGYQSLESLPPSQIVRASSASAGASAAAGAGSAGGKGGKKAGAGEAVGPVCIILEPARDLAEQTYKAIESMRKHVSSPEVSQALFIGGVDKGETSKQLQGGKVPDIITATPGKLLDLIEGHKVNLSQVRLFILDEADRFGSDEEAFKMVSKIYAKVRAAIDGDATAAAASASIDGGRLQVCFFSATLHSPEVTKLSDLMCRHPTWVDLKGKDSVPETVHHLVIPVDPSNDRSWALGSGSGKQSNGVSSAPSGDPSLKFFTDGVHAGDSIYTKGSAPKLAAAAASPAAGAGAGGKGGSSAASAGAGSLVTPEEASEGVKRLKQRMLVSLIDSLKMEQCLIFCRTNVDCDNLEQYLTAVGGGQKFRAGMEKGKENPYSCVVLAGMRSMDERRRNLEAFKSGDVRFLICTDVAARGLDVKELPYVVNMTLPDEVENYIHRIGRAGRAGRMGLAISLVSTVQEKVWYHTCNNRGKGCTNAKLKSQGGCTIWYDEPLMLRSVQKRLGMDPSQGSDEAHKGIPIMPVAYDAMPPPRDALSSLSLKGGSASSSSSSSSTAKPLPYLFSLPAEYADVTYGEERGERSGPNAHVEQIRDKVEVLSALEVQAQDVWLSLQKFNGIMRKGGPAAAAAGASVAIKA